MPRLNAASATMADELSLVRAYLDIMRMRIPDRLSFRIDADPATLALPCPPMAVLTLVENAVRHGIDPAEEGGEIAVTVGLEGRTCHVRVDDGGLGLRPGTGGLGTGLTTLRQRLALSFGPTARLSLAEREAGGVSARLSWPVKGTIA